MQVTLVGGKPQSLKVEEQEDGTYLGENGQVYEMEHVVAGAVFVKKAESIIDSIEDAVESIEDEVGAPASVEAATEKVEGYVETAEDAVAGMLPVEEAEATPEAEDGQEPTSEDEAPEDDAA